MKHPNRLLQFVLIPIILAGCQGKPSQSDEAPATLDYQQFEAFRSATLLPTPECDQHCVDLRNEFAYVVHVGELIYVYWDFKRAETGIDYQQLAQTFEASITTRTTFTEYALILRRWASAFHDGHVNGLLPIDLSSVEIFTSPVRLEVLAPATDHETVIVSDAGGTAGVAVGDIVTAVNGVAIADALTAGTQLTSGSTEKMRRFGAARRLVDVLGVQSGGQELVLSLTHSDGSQTQVNVPRTISLNPSIDPNAPAAPEATGIDLIKATILPGQIGYLRIDGFTGTRDTELLNQAMDRLLTTRALILDVRRNGGGDQSGNTILARLVQDITTRYKVSESVNPFVLSQRPEYAFENWNEGDAFAQWHDLNFRPSPTGQSYRGKPVFAITSPNCFSACDTFVAALKSNHLAQIVGENTGGGTGTPLVFDLPISGTQFRYSVVRGKTSADEWIEGHGTAPDVLIEPTREERIARRDQQLDRVIAMAIEAASGTVRPTPITRDGLAEPVTALFGHPLNQNVDIAPTVVDESWLRRIARIDEK